MDTINGCIKFIFSFMANIIFWIFNFYKIRKAIKLKNEYKKSIRTITNVRAALKKFTWTKDKLFDWRPWSITMFARDFKDDCDGAASFGKFLLKCIKMKSSFYRLTTEGAGHLVTVSDNKKYLISNNRIYEIMPNDWENNVRKRCYKQTGVKFEKIVKTV